MGIQKLKELRADATVCGQTREINWCEDDGMFVVDGVKSFAEAMELLEALGRGGISEMDPSPPVDVSGMSEEQFKDYTRRKYGFDAPSMPNPAADTTPARQAPEEAAAAVKKAAEEIVAKVQLLKQEAAPAPLEPPSSIELPGTKPSASTSSTAPAASAGGEDYAVFGTHTKLSEVVEEIRKRGHNTYEAILAYCKKLQDMGDISPPIDQYGAKLEERLKVHLSGKGLKVPE